MRVVSQDRALVQVGETRGRLTVLGQPFFISAKNGSRWKRRQTVVCECKCGTVLAIDVSSLRSATRSSETSCGCFRNETSAKACKLRAGANSPQWTHGRSTGDRLYRIWIGMHNRCRTFTPNHERYAGRGIRVCSSWDEFAVFQAWALANGYEPHLTLDRRENDQGYSPDNCRWQTPRQQARNRCDNRIFSAFGESKLIVEWSEDSRCIVKHATLRSRVTSYGWDMERALTTKSSHSSKNRVKS